MRNKTKILLAVISIIFLTAKAIAQEKPEVYVQLGHSGHVNSVSFSPDGRLLASGSGDNTVKLWEVATGKLVRTLEGHSYYVNSVTFSPDGRLLASGSDDKTIKLWEVTTGREIRTLKGHKYAVASVSFSPDSRLIASGSGDKIMLWEVTTGKAIRTLQGHNVTSVSFSPDGRLLASGSNDNTIKLWEVTTGKAIRTLQGHSNYITSVAFSPDGKLIASGSFDRTIILWDVETGRDINTLTEHKENVNSVAFSADGKMLASGSDDNTIKLWEVTTGRGIRTLKGHKYAVASVSFSPDSRLIASGGDDNTIVLRDVVTGKETRRLKGYTKYVEALAFSADGKTVAYGSGRRIGLLNVEIGREIAKLNVNSDKVTSLAFSPDGNILAFGTNDFKIKLYDIKSGKEIKTIFNDAHYDVEFVAFSPDGNILGSGGDNIINLWDVSTGKNIRKFYNIGTPNFAFSSDSKIIVSGGTYWGILLIDVIAGKEKENKTNGHTSEITSVALSPNNKIIASGSRDNTIILWDASTLKPIRTLKGHSSNTVAFSADGKFLASGGNDYTVKLWDASTGEQIRTLLGHRHAVKLVTFLPNGKVLASSSQDGTVRLWNVETGKEKAMFVSFADGEWIVITPEGYYDASANGDRYLNVRIGNTVYGIENYRESFFRPDLVKSALAGIELKDFKTLADIKLPPQVEILNAPTSAQQEETDITVKLTDLGGGIGDIRLYLNESAVLVDGARGMKKVDQEKTQTRSYRIKLVNGENVIKVVAFNADNTMQSNAAIHTVAANLKLKKPNMYVLAIGINEFKNPKLELQYAVADAKLFVEALKESAKELFEKIEVRLLTTKEETTKESIKAALEGMRGISPEDVFVFYVASHGIAEEGEYFLLTSNVGSVSTNRLREDALTQAELKEMIANVGSTKKFIALDACHSGKLGEELQVAMLAKTRGMSEETAIKILSRAVGSMILSASTTQQEALEGYQGHGLFTYVLAEGIKGNADKDKDGIIRTVELSDYVDLRVPELAERVFKRAQYPTATPSGQAFPIAKAK